MSNFYYQSSGGCTRCDNMQGFYISEPVRPHPNCTCDIEDLTQSNTDNADWFWDFEGFSAIRDQDGDGYAEHFTLKGHIYVTCIDKTVFDEDFPAEVNFGPTDTSEEAWDRALAEARSQAAKRAQEIIDRNCPRPNPLPTS